MSEIEACRTCGIFFLESSNYLRHLFSTETEMVQVRRELEAWNVKLNENDCYPHYICTVCLLEFRKIFKFQNSCLETQDQLKQLYTIQQDNMKQMQIKTEICDDNIVVKQEPNYITNDNDDQNICAFIYIDDLSDSEFDNEIETTNIPQFKIPHLPLKEEIIEEARVPIDDYENKIDELNVVEAVPLSEIMTTEAEATENGQVDSIITENFPSGVQCEFCLHVSADQQEHRQHLLRIHESKPLECHICGKQFKPGTSQSRLKYHLKWHRINKHIKCPQCGFHCASRDILNEHKRAVHTKRPCTVCGKRFLPKKLRIHLEEHQLGDNTKDPIGCSHCSSVFSTEAELDQHILINHTEDSSIDESGSQVYDQLQETLQDKMIDLESGTESSSAATASTTMSFSPDNSSTNDMSQYYINNDFQQTNEDSYDTILESEMSTVNITPPIDEQMQFACAQCPLSFAKVEQLIAHAEAHQEKEIFRCHICGKRFDLKFSLNRHVKRHKNVTC